MAETAVHSEGPRRLGRLASEAAAAEKTADGDRIFNAYQKLFRAALDGADMEAAADALRGQSRACQLRKRFDEAEEFAQLSLAIAGAAGLARASARALNTLAVVRFQQHDWSGAAGYYTDALDRATDCGDDALVGWSCQNLGVIAHLRGDLRQGRTLYLESVAASVRSGDATTAIAAYNSLGIICSDLREWAEALLYFDHGLELAEKVSDGVVQARMLANRAEPLLQLGEIDRALATLTRAEALGRQLGDGQTLVEVTRFHAMISRRTERYREAEEYLEQAAALAAAEQLPLEQAEVMEEMAQLRWAERRTGAARASAREAIRAYERIGAEQYAASVRRLLHQWTAPQPDL